MSAGALNGSCLCGAIKFTVQIPSVDAAPALLEKGSLTRDDTDDGVLKYAGTNCHCTTCRRSSGALFQTFFEVPQGLFALDAANTAAPKTYQSGAQTHREFCPACGTALFYINESAQPPVVDVALGTLDRRDAARGVKVIQHIYLDDAVKGDGIDVMQLKDGMKWYRRYSSDPEGEWTGYKN